MLKEKPYKVTLVLEEGNQSMKVIKTLDYHRTYITWPENYLLRKLVNLWNEHMVGGDLMLTEDQALYKFGQIVHEHYGHLIQEVVHGTAK